jgi:NADPH2:quinone reductase
VEVGSETDQLSIGDRVLALCGAGAFQRDVVVTPPMPVLKLPDAMPFDDAAAFNMTYGTACHAWDRGQLVSGDTVLVLGAAGGCGSAAVEIAKAMGATVIAAARGPEKLALCQELGADHVVDYTEVDSLSDVVQGLTGGRGVDALFDTVGGADIREYLRSLAWNGRYLVVGFASGEVPNVRLYQTIAKSISIVGIAYGASAMQDEHANRAMFDRLFAWYERGEVRPRIGHRFPLEHGAEAIRVLGERRAMGKVVIELTPTD